jgi:hypothetical protein
MSIFRDIGQTVGNLLRPDGNPILQVANNAGVAIGSVRNITNAIAESAATLNPNLLNKVLPDPSKIPLIKSFSFAAPPPGGPPYENVLEQFASYTPLWTLCCLEPNQFNDPTTYRGNPWALNHVVLSSAGRYDAERANTAYGAPEYFIDNVTMQASLGGSAKTGNTNVTSFSFEVYEPYSLGVFLQSLQSAALGAGYPSYLNDTPYLLKLEFVGFQDNGAIFESSEKLTKYFTIKITKVEFNVNEGGSKYKIEASPFHHQGFSDIVNNAPTDLKITGMKVNEVLVSGPQSLCTALNAIQLEKVDSGQAEIPDLYEVVFPIDASDKVGLEENANIDVLKAMADPNAEKTQRIEAVERELTAESFGQGEIGMASMGFSETSGGNYNFKLEGDVIDPDTGRIKRDSMSIDPKQREIVFPQGTKITEIIKMVVLSSQYCVESLKGENIDDNGMIDWFRIDVQIQLLDYDKIRNLRAKKFIYRVVPFKVSGSIFKNPSSVTAGESNLQKIICKRYDYLYTGQNNDLLKFDLTFNGMFFTGVMPRPPQYNAQVSNTDQQNSAPDATPQARLKTGDAPSSATSASGSPPVKGDTKLSAPSASGEKTVEQIIADAFNKSFQASSDLTSVKIDILGDPYFLSDSGINSNYLAEYGPNEQVTSDGSMNWEGSQIFVYITWRNPLEPNLGTTGQGGLMNFPDGGAVTPFSGIYHVKSVENRFSGGTFQQTLDLARQVNQQLDYNGQETISKQNQTMYDTSKVEPPKTSPTDSASELSDAEIAANNAALGDFMG